VKYWIGHCISNSSPVPVKVIDHAVKRVFYHRTDRKHRVFSEFGQCAQSGNYEVFTTEHTESTEGFHHIGTEGT
jgi:hypothetical protein